MLKQQCTTHKQTDVSTQLKRTATEKKRHISDSRTVSLPNNHSKASKSTIPDLIHLYCIARAATWFRGRENTKNERKKASCKCSLYAAEDSFLKKTGNLPLVLDLLCFVTHSCQKIPKSQESQRLRVQTPLSVFIYCLWVCMPVWGWQ